MEESNEWSSTRLHFGPTPVLLYVNDIPDAASSTAKMFADDTKLYHEIDNIGDCETLQQDLNSLSV